MKNMKRGKTVGNGQIDVKVLMHLGDTGVNILEKLFDELNSDGEIVDELLETTFTPIPKKPKANKCGNYPNVSIISHTTRILQKVLSNRMKTDTNPEMNEC